jgi:hypothetical protein
MNATLNSETCAIEFHVIAGNGKPLLGRKSATELGLLHIGSVNCMRKSTTDEIIGWNLLTLSIYVLIVSSF